MTRSIGVLGTVANIVGVVSGIAIFILPGHLAGSAGPAVVVSYLLAALIAAFACAVAAQVGSAFPVSGASFVSVSRTLSPMLGFLIVWMMLAAIVLGIALLALGFADYLRFFLPWINRTDTALILVLALGGINLLGVRSSLAIQIFLVVCVVAALALFGFVGVLHANWHRFSPFAPNGFGPVLLSTIPAFFSFSAFAVVIELGGDIKRPGRTIPLAFVISFSIVTLIYVSVTIATVGNLPWQQLGSLAAPVGDIAGLIMSPLLAKTIVLVALAGAASPVNSLILSYSRDIMVLAKSGVFPTVLGRVSRSRDVPSNAIICIVLAAVLIIPASGRLAEIATLSTLSILLLQIALGVVLLRLPYTSPAILQAAKFRLSSGARWLFAVGLIIMSAVLLCVAAWGKPELFLAASAVLLVGCTYYLLRKLYLKHSGIDVDKSVLNSQWT